MGTVKGFWQYLNGDIYAIESTTYGKIVGAAGPLSADELGGLEDYDYKRGIVDWVERTVAEGKMHRYIPEERRCHYNNKAYLRIKWIRRFLSHRALRRRIGL